MTNPRGHAPTMVCPSQVNRRTIFGATALSYNKLALKNINHNYTRERCYGACYTMRITLLVEAHVSAENLRYILKQE